MMNWWTDHEAPESPTISIGAVTDPGFVRDENQDAYGHFSADDGGERLFVVADGMGGHVRGREASTTAVDVIRDAVCGDSQNGLENRLRSGFRQANEEVYRRASVEDGGTMGTTATALVLGPHGAHVAHVGDSRLYRFREGEVELLTTDHTVVQAMRQQGTVTEEEAKTHPRRGTLTRAIGVESRVEIDVLELPPPSRGERFLLCTDGLQDVPQTVLLDVVVEHDAQEACRRLVERAKQRGGYDNVTALVVHVK